MILIDYITWTKSIWEDSEFFFQFSSSLKVFGADCISKVLAIFLKHTRVLRACVCEIPLQETRSFTLYNTISEGKNRPRVLYFKRKHIQSEWGINLGCSHVNGSIKSDFAANCWETCFWKNSVYFRGVRLLFTMEYPTWGKEEGVWFQRWVKNIDRAPDKVCKINFNPLYLCYFSDHRDDSNKWSLMWWGRCL